MCELIEPSSKFLAGNVEFLKELLDKGEISSEEYVNKVSSRKDINSYLDSLKKLDSEGIGLHIFWLVDGDEFIGTLRLTERLSNDKRLKDNGNIGYEIRPSKQGQGYGVEILRLGLLKAREFEMKELIIECREDNIASRKIIEKNGGRFIESRVDKSGEPNLLKYVIIL